MIIEQEKKPAILIWGSGCRFRGKEFISLNFKKSSGAQVSGLRSEKVKTLEIVFTFAGFS